MTKHSKAIAAIAIVVVAIVGFSLIMHTAFGGGKEKGGDGTAAASGSTRLYIYNWTYYTPDSVIDQFEKEFNCTVIYDQFASNEDMYAKLQASGGAGYDIVFPSSYFVPIMVSQGMIAEIDTDKIPNLKNIDPILRKKMKYDPQMRYSVPYYWGAAGVAVNTAKVPEFERSWSIFTRKDLAGRMTMLDDVRDVFGAALVCLGDSVNTKDPGDVESAAQFIKSQWQPNIVRFDSEGFGKGYARGDFWVSHAFSEGIFEEIQGNEQLENDTVFFIPNEGGPAYIDCMCIMAGSQNRDLAHEFINFIHRPEIYAEFCDAFGFPSGANVPARDLKKVKAWYSIKDLERTELTSDVGEALRYYNHAWFEDIRVGG